MGASMPSKSELVQHWSDAQSYSIPLDKDGRIIDFLDPDTRRDNKPEERIRQRMAQVLHFELGYPRELIAFERTIQIGQEKKRADIVVFNSVEGRASNDQGQISIVGETKAPLVKAPDGQILSYLSASSAAGGFWTNGDTSPIHYYRKQQTGQIVPWLGIPKYGFAWDSIGRFKKTDLIIPIDLKIAFRRCHNAIYRTGIDSEDVALDMVRIILAKIEDESSSSETCDFHITDEEFNNENSRKSACARVRKLFESVKARFQDVFNPHEEITASDQQLATVISYLQQYAFLDAPYDVIGTAYEVYVASYLKGERGQYFTNRLVVDMMVRIANPSDKDIILDPACGSGGFLISAMNYIFRKVDHSNRPQSAKDLLKRNVCHNIFGIDTTPKLVKVAKANMLLSRDGHTGIVRANSLGKLEELPAPFVSQAGIERPS
jgi:type I restriction enzyme M protein